MHLPPSEPSGQHAEKPASATLLQNVRRLRRVLVVATKLPWPSVDGGRRLLANQLSGLDDAGVEVTLVAPCSHSELAAASREAPPSVRIEAVTIARSGSSVAHRLLSLANPRLLWQPYSLVRHRSAAVRRRIDAVLREHDYDLIHVEQLQALALLPPTSRLPPLVVRAQNVESDLWFGLANSTLPRSASLWRRGEWAMLRPLFRVQAKRLQRQERRRLNEVPLVLALSNRDASRLREIGVRPQRIRVLAAPFPGSLPGRRDRLPGDPALVLLGSGGWLPNQLANDDFVAEVWPQILTRWPDAKLHCFGGKHSWSHSPGVVLHRRPREACELFDPRACLLVPLDAGSGVRIKILDAWARGMPVIASSVAVRGLDEAPDVESRNDSGPMPCLVADTTSEWIRAIEKIGDPLSREALVSGGRSRLRAMHSPARCTAALLAHYEQCLG